MIWASSGRLTANMSPARAFGVYAIVDVLEGPHKGSYGAASTAPMFGENKANIETYSLTSKATFMARRSVGLVEHLRGEEKFDSLDALITQMGQDCDRARTIWRRYERSDPAGPDPKFWEKKALTEMSQTEWELRQLREMLLNKLSETAAKWP